jgi:hypothetical protein
MTSTANYTISPKGKTITCHKCGLTSSNLKDVANRYCGGCHIFHEDMRFDPKQPPPAEFVHDVLDEITDIVLAYRRKPKATRNRRG